MDFAKAREFMVEQQVRPWDVLDSRVLKAMSRIPREDFVAPEQRNLAYADVDLPLGDGSFNRKPVFQGRVLQSVLVQPDETVLEIATGTGYQTACLASLAGKVVSIESNPARASAAAAKLADMGYTNATVIQGDALSADAFGDGQFDAIVVNSALSDIPAHFLAALKPGGRMFFVRGESPAMEACVLTRDGGSGYSVKVVFETDIPYLDGAAPASTFTL